MWKLASELEVGETAYIGSYNKVTVETIQVTVETIQVFETGTVINGEVYLPHRCAYVIS